MGRLARMTKKLTALPGSVGALLSLSSAVGLVLGARAVVALELPGWNAIPGLRGLLGVQTLPREAMGMLWSPRVVWPGDLQSLAAMRIATLVAALLLAAASVSLLNALVLLLEAGAARRREMAIRAAVGAGPRRLLGLLLRQVRTVVIAGFGLGLLLGMTSGGAVRAAWPGDVAALDPAAATGTLVPVLLTLLGLCLLAYLKVGLGMSRQGVLSTHLGAGGRATADRGEAFQRRMLSAVQMGAAGAVSLGTLALAFSVAGPVTDSAASGNTVTVGVTAPEDVDGDGWASVMGRVAALPGLEAESLASPGAVLGLGVRDNATAQCGDCYRGGLPLPFWGARADHHAVAPGFFRAAGLTVSEGRAITDEDVASGKRVALVNRTFANEAFEDGKPLGHLVKLGRSLEGWYEVVGVVEDQPTPTLGGDDLRRSAVYVSAYQQAPRHADVLLRGSDDAITAAVALLAGAGYAPDTPRTLAEVRLEAAAPLLWTARVALLLGLLTLALAVHGSHATALQVTRRRTRELAIRRVMGATDGRLLRFVLGGSARTALWGAALATFFGTLIIGLLRKTAGGIPAPRAEWYVMVTAVLVGTALLASVKAAREALEVEPATAVE